MRQTIQTPPAVGPAAPDGAGSWLPADAAASLDEDEEFVLALARREPLLTPKRLMHTAQISRATATRRLTRLVEKGWLTAHGKGRSAHYRLTCVGGRHMSAGCSIARTGDHDNSNDAHHALV